MQGRLQNSKGKKLDESQRKNVDKQEDLYALLFGVGLMPEILLCGIPHQKQYFIYSWIYSFQL